MTEESIHTDNRKDDIDLLVLAERCLLFFRRYKWLFLAALLLGLATGYYFYRSIPNTYTSRLVVHSFMLTNQEEIQVVSNWNRLLGKKEYDALAAALNCDPQILRSVKRIKASEIQQVFTTVNPHGFVIDVLVTDNGVLDSLQAGIVYGFENSLYTRERLDVKKEHLREMIRHTETEISKLESNKGILEAVIRGQGRTSSPMIVDGASANRQLIEMNEKLLGLREALQFTRAVQVLQPFSKFSKPSDPKLIPWLIIGSVAFTGIAYIISLIHSINRQLRTRTIRRTS